MCKNIASYRSPRIIVVLLLSVVIGDRVDAEVYRITGGKFSCCGSYDGGVRHDLPAPTQWFIDLKQTGDGNSVQMRILDPFLEEFRPRPVGFETSGVGFVAGTIEANTVRFFDEHLDPESPLSDERGMMDYTISFQEDGLELNGAFVMWPSPCADCYDTFGHSNVSAVAVGKASLGDLNGDSRINGEDLQLLERQGKDYWPSRVGFQSPGLREAMWRWVKEIRSTWIGDANVNGEFDSGDLVQVLEAGKYETQEDASWSEGDWNADGMFDTGDLMLALADGGYEMGSRLPGDYNRNGFLDANDIDLLTDAIHRGPPWIPETVYDLNADGHVDMDDRDFWVRELVQTWYGDANLDGKFNTGDLVQVLAAGKYETDQSAGWGEGDWNGDGVFGTGDLVRTLGECYEDCGVRHPRIVPEPSAYVLWLVGMILLRVRRH